EGNEASFAASQKTNEFGDGAGGSPGVLFHLTTGLPFQEKLDAAAASLAHGVQDASARGIQEWRCASFDALILLALVPQDGVHIVQAEPIALAGQTQIDTHFRAASPVELPPPGLPKRHQVI